MNEISIDDVSKRFEEHLGIKDNFRIILSGKFGIGKTFFLKKYFEQREDKYNTILLSPVNYVVSSNEDIFELIKADIIKDLFLTKKIDLKKLPEDNTLQKISNYVEDKSAVLGNFMLKFITRLSTSSEIPKEVIDTIGNIYKDYQKKSKDKRPEEKTRSEELMDYWADIEEKIGNIYEHNYVTKVINTFLEEIRNEKKNVLVIDDLDRIDPEHIFRILNILSVHNNHFDSENKFSFDHVILVCDLENIKKIYFHRYGNGVDFEGYIDKFYSTHILDFTNNDAVITYVRSIFEANEENKPYLDFVTLMLQNFVQHDLVSVRKLLKHSYEASVDNFILQQQSGINEETLYLHNGVEFIRDMRNLYVESDDFSILQFFRLMTFIFGDFNNFYKSLLELKSSKLKIQYKDGIDLIPFLALQYHISSKSADDLFFSKYYSKESSHNYLASVSWPEINFLGRDFRINLKWYKGDPYDGTASYFHAAKAHDKSSRYDEQTLAFNLSAIFKTVEEIANDCIDKGYLTKAGITFKKSNA